jgi:hypothetical protein
MLQRVKRAIPIVVYMFAHCAMAAEQTVTCPTEIPEASIRIANTPAGWQPYVASPLFLSSAGAMDLEEG